LEKELCPRCGTEMAQGREPLRIDDSYVGHYDAMSCPICKYYYFTDVDYDSALSDARRFGLVGPSLPVFIEVLTHEGIDLSSIRPTGPFVKKFVPFRLGKGVEGFEQNTTEPPLLEITHQLVVTAQVKVGAESRQ